MQYSQKDYTEVHLGTTALQLLTQNTMKHGQCQESCSLKKNHMIPLCSILFLFNQKKASQKLWQMLMTITCKKLFALSK